MALVLTLKISDSVTIKTLSGETVQVVFPKHMGNKIRLGFNAERTVSIVRDNAINKSPGYMGDVNGPGCDPDTA